MILLVDIVRGYAFSYSAWDGEVQFSIVWSGLKFLVTEYLEWLYINVNHSQVIVESHNHRTMASSLSQRIMVSLELGLQDSVIGNHFLNGKAVFFIQAEAIAHRFSSSE